VKVLAVGGLPRLTEFMTRTDLHPAEGAALGGLLALGTAMVLVPLRDSVANTSIALLLVIPVVIGALLGGRIGGAVSAGFAVLAFDFFHTQPYLSLTIASLDDVETAAILLVVGLIVGTAAAHTGRFRRVAAAGRDEIQRLHHVAEMVANGASAPEVIDVTGDELRAVLTLADCRFETAPFDVALPRLDRNGALAGTSHRYVHGGFVLPSEPVELSVLSRGRRVARFVLQPSDAEPVSLEQRLTAIALADQVGSVLVRSSTGPETDRSES
jgi:Domain of unknown function (DUF4118)